MPLACAVSCVLGAIAGTSTKHLLLVISLTFPTDLRLLLEYHSLITLLSRLLAAVNPAGPAPTIQTGSFDFTGHADAP